MVLSQRLIIYDYRWNYLFLSVKFFHCGLFVLRYQRDELKRLILMDRLRLLIHPLIWYQYSSFYDLLSKFLDSIVEDITLLVLICLIILV